MEAQVAALENQILTLQGQVAALIDLPVLNIDDVSLAEGNSGPTAFVFTVTLSAPSSLGVTVDYATANGSAQAPGDYTHTSGTLIFGAGETSKTITVPVTGDTLSELHETFYVNLTNATHAVIRDGQGLGTILNDDTPRITINDTSCSEGAYCVFTVRLSGPTHEQVRVDYATANGTAQAGTHYEATSNTLVFSPGTVERQIQVRTFSRTFTSGDYSFFVNLTSPTQATILDDQGRGIIRY